ncbi:hypothetical protein B0H14DRAFT_1165522 [Mycena olivaceomarginata]|nr:hypothetical protein B0H14DRAFT_1165522 [Mycena olivaceomarginata]
MPPAALLDEVRHGHGERDDAVLARAEGVVVVGAPGHPAGVDGGVGVAAGGVEGGVRRHGGVAGAGAGGAAAAVTGVARGVRGGGGGGGGGGIPKGRLPLQRVVCRARDGEPSLDRACAVPEVPYRRLPLALHERHLALVLGLQLILRGLLRLRRRRRRSWSRTRHRRRHLRKLRNDPQRLRRTPRVLPPLRPLPFDFPPFPFCFRFLPAPAGAAPRTRAPG